MAGRVATSLAREGMRALLDGRSRSDRSGAAKRSKAPKTPGTVATPQHSRGGGRRSPASNAPADTGYRGDWHGALPATSWQAKDDGRPDPGEIVWAWVPYEEDHTQGKDRPVLVVARHPQEDGVTLALPLTSRDHDRDAAQEARAGRHWMDIGSGAWDRAGRPSEVRLDRILQLDEASVRREGTALDRGIFESVIAAVPGRR